MWDLADGNPGPAWTAVEGFGLFDLAVSPCGRYAVGADDRGLQVWGLRNPGRPPRYLHAESDPDAPDDHITRVAFTPDGKQVLTVVMTSGVRRWRVGSWQRLPRIGGPRHRWNGRPCWFGDELAVSPDGRTVAVGHRLERYGDESGWVIRLWDLATGRARRPVATGNDDLWHLRFTPDGSRLVSAHRDPPRVRTWDAVTLAPLAEYRPQLARRKDASFYVAIHPSGRWLAVTGVRGRVDGVDLPTLRPTHALDWWLGNTCGVGFAADGTMAACGVGGGRVVVWDTEG